MLGYPRTNKCVIEFFHNVDTRKALNIEDHWSSAKKPLIDVSPLNSREYDERFDELLEQYPIPSDYGAETNNSTPSIDGQDVMVDSDQDRDVHDVTKAYQNNVIMEPFAMKSLLKHGKEKPRGGKGRSEQNSKNAHNGDYVHQEGERAKRVGRKKSSIRRK